MNAYFSNAVRESLNIIIHVHAAGLLYCYSYVCNETSYIIDTIVYTDSWFLIVISLL